MDKKESFKQFAAGGFFLAGIALIFIFVLTIGRDKGFAEAKFQVSVLFRSVGGLSEGAPVRLLGVNVGNVDTIEFLNNPVEGRAVRVKLNIFSKYQKQLEKGTKFSIKTEGLLGEKLVEIYASDDQKRMDWAQPIIGEDPFDAQDLAVVFGKAAESFTKTSNELSKIDMIELTNIMTESSRALLITSEGLNEIMFDLQDITKKSRRLFDRIEQKVIDGTLFKVF